MLNYDAFVDYWSAKLDFDSAKCRQKFIADNPRALSRSPSKLAQALAPQLTKLLDLEQDEVVDWCRILLAGFYYSFETTPDAKVKAIQYAYCDYVTNTTIRDHLNFQNATEDDVCVLEGDSFMLPKFMVKKATGQSRDTPPDLLSRPLTFTLAANVVQRDTNVSEVRYVDVDCLYAASALSAHSKKMLPAMSGVIRKCAEEWGTYFSPTFASAELIMLAKGDFTEEMAIRFDDHCQMAWNCVFPMRQDTKDLVRQYVNTVNEVRYLEKHGQVKLLLQHYVAEEFARGVGVWIDLGYSNYQPSSINHLFTRTSTALSVATKKSAVFYPIGQNATTRMLKSARRTNIPMQGQYLSYDDDTPFVTAHDDRVFTVDRHRVRWGVFNRQRAPFMPLFLKCKNSYVLLSKLLYSRKETKASEWYSSLIGAGEAIDESKITKEDTDDHITKIVKSVVLALVKEFQTAPIRSTIDLCNRSDEVVVNRPSSEVSFPAILDLFKRIYGRNSLYLKLHVPEKDVEWIMGTMPMCDKYAKSTNRDLKLGQTGTVETSVFALESLERLILTGYYSYENFGEKVKVAYKELYGKDLDIFDMPNITPKVTITPPAPAPPQKVPTVVLREDIKPLVIKYFSTDTLQDLNDLWTVYELYSLPFASTLEWLLTAADTYGYTNCAAMSPWVKLAGCAALSAGLLYDHPETWGIYPPQGRLNVNYDSTEVVELVLDSTTGLKIKLDSQLCSTVKSLMDNTRKYMLETTLRDLSTAVPSAPPVQLYSLDQYLKNEDWFLTHMGNAFTNYLNRVNVELFTSQAWDESVAAFLRINTTKIVPCTQNVIRRSFMSRGVSRAVAYGMPLGYRVSLPASLNGSTPGQVKPVMLRVGFVPSSVKEAYLEDLKERHGSGPYEAVAEAFGQIPNVMRLVVPLQTEGGHVEDLIRCGYRLVLHNGSLDLDDDVVRAAAVYRHSPQLVKEWKVAKAATWGTPDKEEFLSEFYLSAEEIFARLPKLARSALALTPDLHRRASHRLVVDDANVVVVAPVTDKADALSQYVNTIEQRFSNWLRNNNIRANNAACPRNYSKVVIPLYAEILHKAHRLAMERTVPPDSLLADKYRVERMKSVKRLLFEEAVLSHQKRRRLTDTEEAHVLVTSARNPIDHDFMNPLELIRAHYMEIAAACFEYVSRTPLEINKISPGYAVYEHPGYPRHTRADVVRKILVETKDVPGVVFDFLNAFCKPEVNAYVYVRNSIDGLERVDLSTTQKLMDVLQRRLDEYRALPGIDRERVVNGLEKFGLPEYGIHAPLHTNGQTGCLDIEKTRDELVCRLNNLF